MLVTHPFRGPARLYRDYVRTRKREAAGDRRQLSAVTCLFLVYFVVLGLTGGIANANLKAPVATIAAHGPTLDIEAIWVPVLAAMVTTVAIDVALRLALRLRYFRDARKRRLALPILQYAMILPSIVIVVAPMLYLVWLIFSLDGMAPVIAIIAAWLAAAVLSCVPAAAMLIPRRYPATPLRRAAFGGLRWLAAPFAAAVVIFSAGLIGVQVHDQIREMRDADQAATASFKVTEVRCRLRAAQPHVELLAVNASKEPVLVPDGNGVKLVLFDFDDQGEMVNEVSYPATLPGGDDVPGVLVRPNGSEVIRLVPHDFDAAKMPKRESCAVRGGGLGWPVRRYDGGYGEIR